MRGVYLNKNRSSKNVITSEDVYFAIPKLKGQLSCQDFYNGIYIKEKIDKNEPLMHKNIFGKEEEKNISKKAYII